MRFRSALYVAALAAAFNSASSLAGSPGPEPAPSPVEVAAFPTVIAPSTLPAGTPVFVMLDQELSTKVSKVGDQFQVTVLHDVIDNGTVVIPKGTTGFGDVTFTTNNGGFGKPGILSISLRYLELKGAKVPLDGHYREEGANKNGATAATWFAVGIFSGFIRGKPGVIPKGRELKARTAEDIAFVAGNQPRATDAPPTPPEAANANLAAPLSPAVNKD